VINGTSGAAMIVFKNGLVVRAETSALDGTLGNDLLQSGMIKESALNLAVKVKKSCPVNQSAKYSLTLARQARSTWKRQLKEE